MLVDVSHSNINSTQHTEQDMFKLIQDLLIDIFCVVHYLNVIPIAVSFQIGIARRCDYGIYVCHQCRPVL